MCDHSGKSIVFMHIPKTGGKSLDYMLKHIQGHDWRLKSFYHHPPIGYKRIAENPELRGLMRAGCPLVLLTVLRDPLRRVVSEWFHYGVVQFVKKPPMHLPSSLETFKSFGFDMKNGSAALAMKLAMEFTRANPHRLSPKFGGRMDAEVNRDVLFSYVQ